MDVDAAPALVLIEAVRIGSIADAQTGFASVGGVAVDRDGAVYVYDRLFREIRVYSPIGQFLRTIGGPGEGPGEFGSGTTVRFGVVEDVVWTWEGGASDPGRLTIFTRDGTVISTAPVTSVPYSPGDESCSLVAPAALGTDSLFRSAPPGGVRLAPCESIGILGVRQGLPAVRFRMDGTVADTVGFLPTRERPPPRILRVGSSEYLLPEPPSDAPLFIDLLDGSAVRVDRPLASVAGEGSFRVARFMIEGDTISLGRYRYTPVRYPEAVLDRAAVRVAQAPSPPLYTPSGRVLLRFSPSDSARARGVVRERMGFPEFQPPVQDVRVGQDGALWLLREDTGEELLSWLVIEEDGELRGTVTLPRTRARIVWSAGGTAWAVETDALGVPWVVQYRIVEDR